MAPRSRIMPEKRRHLPPPEFPVKKSKASYEDDIRATELLIIKAIEDGTSLNAVADLIRVASTTKDAKLVHASLYALYRVFALLASDGRLYYASGKTEAELLIVRWLEAQLSDFDEILVGLLHSNESALRVASLDILFALLGPLSVAPSSSTPRLHLPHFRKIVQAVVFCPEIPDPSMTRILSVKEPGYLRPDVRDHFLSKYLSPYDDVRWFFLRETANLLKDRNKASAAAANNILSLLERLTTMPTKAEAIASFLVQGFAKPLSEFDASEELAEDSDDWRKFFDEPIVDSKGPTEKKKRVNHLSIYKSVHSLESHRVQFSQCWAALVPFLSASPEMSTRALTFLHRGVLPHMTKPARLMDWLSTSIDFGGSIGLLALNGLFTLIKDHNLDYPEFYTRLYAYMDNTILHVKHRARFFRLIEVFLSSTHLPAQLLASFVKRLSRLSLSAPPPALVMIMPFVYNILKKHPALMVMIHQDPTPNYLDPFDPAETSPLLTNALASSLWELAALQNHYLETVSTLARLFTSPFTKQPFSMEDFLDHTYTTMFETEAKRSFKKDPAIAVHVLKIPFPITPIAGEEAFGSGDIVTNLWRFS